MKYFDPKPARWPISLTALTLLWACAPHPGSGTWQAEAENTYGIRQLALEYDGKAAFTTQTKDPADWHCFWGGIAKNIVSLKCTPSSDPQRKETYHLTVKKNDMAELAHEGRLIGTFKRQHKDG